MIDNVIVVVVAVNYTDKLRITLERNKGFFSKYIVITSPNDKSTIDICKRFGVTCCIFHKFYASGAKFNKSGAIHDLQQILHTVFPEHWIMLLDADIILPPNIEELLLRSPLDRNVLYSLPRKDYATYLDYQTGTNLRPYLLNFMGFMQLYFDKSKLYAPISYSCAGCDWDFRELFGSHVKLLDEDAYIVHLGEDTVNHNGRTSEMWE